MEYNPHDVSRWEEKTFVTENSQYTIQDGKICGRPSIEGARVIFVNGISDERWRELHAELHSSPEVYTPALKKRFDDLSLEVPRIPEKGLPVAIGIADENAEGAKRVGLATSRLVAIG